MRLDEPAGDVEWADLRSAAGWAGEHRVVLGTIVLIVASLAWKAQFLDHLYFRQDDFHYLDVAVEQPLSWGYLTSIGAGHLIIGLRALAWVIARTTLYNWGLASAVSLAFVAAAGVAAYRTLRTLFGDRPGILIPLAIYLMTPLTLPDLGWWSSAMESLPLQLAIFMALTAHVHYIRTGRTKHLVAAVSWVAFGLVFFEKTLVLPLLLFAVTAAFLTDARTLRAGAQRALVSFWRSWLVYGVLMVGYASLLLASLLTSSSGPQAPSSIGSAVQFAGRLVKNTFLPGAIGGPWRWLPLSGGSYALASPPTTLIWLSAVVAAMVLAASIMYRRVGWRAWAILAAWIVVADMVPVVVGRINAIGAVILGLETRYVADAAPVLAICIGLACWPVVGAGQAELARSLSRHEVAAYSQPITSVAAALIGVFVFGSIWSAQAYERVTTGLLPRSYIANAALALKLAPRGISVLDRPVPSYVEVGLFVKSSLESTVIGDMATGRLAGKLHWVSRPDGTVDKLYMFGADGRLYPAWVYPTSSLPRATGQRCWPEHHGKIVVKFSRPTSIYTGIMRIGYIWYSQFPSAVTITYGGSVKMLEVKPGLHTGFVSETGGYVGSVVVGGMGDIKMCVGDVEAGNLRPATSGHAIPGISLGAR